MIRFIRILFPALQLLALSLALVGAQTISDSYRDALVDYKSGQFAAAAQAVEKALTENPKDSRTLLLRGRIRTALKQYDLAEKDLRAALITDQSSILGYFYLGNLFFVQHQYPQARTQFTDYRRLAPKDSDATLKLIYCDLALGDFGSARRLANTLDLFDEKNPSAYFANAAVAHFSAPAAPTVPGESAPADANTFLHQAELLYGNLIYTQYLPDYLSLTSSAPASAK